MMTNLPTVVVFDVNETLSDVSSIADRFVDVGAPEPPNCGSPRCYATVSR
ncbi:MAG: hypothetical protein WKF73_01440 [Nocardioidaceae bacterium]